MSSTETGARSSSVRRGLVWSTVNNLSLRLVSIAVTAVVARILTPGEFGVFFVAMTVQVILGTLAEFGLGSDLIRSDDPERKAPTIATLALGLAGVTSLVMALGATPIAEAFQSPEAAPVIRLMSLSVLISGMSVVPAALLQRHFEQKKIFVADGTGVVVSAVVTIVLSLLGLGAMSLAWARIASQLATTVLQYRFTRRLPSWGWSRHQMQAIVRFGAPLAGANFLSWLLLSVDNLVVARASDAITLGLYVIAFNVSSWPMGAIGQAVRVVALPGFAQADDGQHRANRMLAPAVSLTYIAGLWIGLMIAVLAEPVVVVLFGEQWRPAAAALQGLALFGALRVVFDLVATFLIARGATRQVLVVQTVWIVALVPSIVVGVKYWGLAGAGYAHLAVTALVVLPAYLVAVRRVGVRVRPVLLALAVPTAVALPVAVVTHFLADRIANPFLALLVGGLVGSIGYAAALVTRGRRDLATMSAPATAPPVADLVAVPEAP